MNFQDSLKRRIGYFDYNDLATQTTPLSVTGGAGWINLTNDGAGDYTNKTYKPTTIDDVWDSANNQFDFSELGLGDMVNIRLDISVTTASPDTTIDIRMLAGIGSAVEYSLTYIADANYQLADSYQVIRFNGMHMGGSETLNYPAKLQIKSDKTCDVVVAGWYIEIFRTSI